MSSRYSWHSTSRVNRIFPMSKIIGGKEYRQSLINPDLVRNTTPWRAERDAEQLRKEGWLARIVKFHTPQGYIYLIYERRK